jgi:hypothetical protein
MPYPQRQTRRPEPHANRSVLPEFDLHTNHVPLPRYEPAHDRNLVYFFDKASNRRILDDLKLLERSNKIKSKACSIDRPHNLSVNATHQNKVKRISKLDFDQFIEVMKARVASEHATG